MELVERQEVIVWLTYSRFNRRLRKFGTIIYVSFRMKYVVMYIDKDKIDMQMRRIQKLSCVTKAELSPRKTLETNYENKMGSAAISKQASACNEEDQ